MRRLGDARTLDLDRRVLALLRWEWTCGFDVEGMDLKTLVAARVEINRCVVERIMKMAWRTTRRFSTKTP